MNDQSTFIPDLRQQTQFSWTNTVASENASHDKSWVVKDLFRFSEYWTLRLGKCLVSVKAWKPVTGWDASPACHSLRTKSSISSSFVAVCKVRGRPPASFPCSCSCIDHYDNPADIKATSQFRNFGPGLRRSLHTTPAILQRTEHGVVCLLDYWLHVDSETAVGMSYQNQCILPRD